MGLFLFFHVRDYACNVKNSPDGKFGKTILKGVIKRMIYCALFLLLGITIGFTLGCIMVRSKIVGVLRFYDQDPGEPPVMTAELHEMPESIRRKKYAIFEVSHK